MTVAAAALTSFYSWRPDLQDVPRRAAHPHHYYEAASTRMSESGMLVPLAPLGDRFRSRPAGRRCLLVHRPRAQGSFSAKLLNARLRAITVLEDMENLSLLTISLAPTVDDDRRISWSLGSSTSRRPDIPERAGARAEPALQFSSSTNGTSTKSTTSSLFVPPCGSVRLFWKGGDGFIIDGFGPDGVSARVLDVTRNVVRLQTGYLYHYAFAMLIGVAALITWFMFSGAHG